MRLCPSRIRCSAASVMPRWKSALTIVGVCPPDAPQHLHDRQARRAERVDRFRRGAFRRREQDAVDPMLLHAGDEAALALRRFRGVGDEGDPARLVEHVVDSGGELGVERIGDLADDEPDGMGDARAQIGRGAVVDISERVDRRLARPRGSLPRRAGYCAGPATPSPAKRPRGGRCPSPSDASESSRTPLFRSF